MKKQLFLLYSLLLLQSTIPAYCMEQKNSPTQSPKPSPTPAEKRAARQAAREKRKQNLEWKKKEKETQSAIISSASTPINIPQNNRCNDEEDSSPLPDHLMESKILTPSPTKRGLGIGWTLKTYAFGKKNMFLSDLETGKLDPDNKSYHNLASTSIDEFATADENKNLTKALKLLREKHEKQIIPSSVSCVTAHKYLAKKNKEKQQDLKKALETINSQATQKTDTGITDLTQKTGIGITEAMQKFNTKIIAMQKWLKERTDELKEELQKDIKNLTEEQQTYLHTLTEETVKYSEEKEKIINESCSKIREDKEALLNLHRINRDFILPQTDDGYCSDHEVQGMRKKIKDPEQVGTFYDNSHIVNKIGMDTANAATLQQLNDKIATTQQQLSDRLTKIQQQLDSRLNTLNDINDQLQQLPALTL